MTATQISARLLRLRPVLTATVLTCAIILATGVASARAGDVAFWTNQLGNSISVADIDGGEGHVLREQGATISSPEGAAIDSVHGRIYWANRAANKISWANLDGSGGGDLNTGGATVDEPEGVAIDANGLYVRPRIYWANRGANKISWASLEGTGGGDVNTRGLTVDEPVGVAIDQGPFERLYWANDDGGSPSIAYTNIYGYELFGGGYGGGSVNTKGATLKAPSGLAVDQAGERVYWANSGQSETHEYKISFAQLDGSGGADLDTNGAVVKDPVGVALDPEADRIYWVNQSSDEISYANLDGGGSGDIRALGAPADAPAFLALMQPPVPGQLLGPFIFWGGQERTPPVGKMLDCNETAPTWEPDLPGAFLFRAPSQRTISWQLNGLEIPGHSTPPASYSLTPTEPGVYSCRMTAVNAAGSSYQTSQLVQVVPAPPTPVVPPILARLLESNRAFVPAGSSTALTGHTSLRMKRGTIFSFTLDLAATVMVRIERADLGRRVGKVCRPRSKRLTRRPVCALYATVATLTRTAHSGANRLPFTGRIHGSALKPGHYRAVFTATDSAGASVPHTISFIVDWN